MTINFYKEIIDNYKKLYYYIINLNNSSTEKIEIILSYLYYESITLTKLQSREILNLLFTIRFLTFYPSILVTIFKRDDFCIGNEGIAWKNLLSWSSSVTIQKFFVLHLFASNSEGSDRTIELISLKSTNLFTIKDKRLLAGSNINSKTVRTINTFILSP
ncbi:hypothetical protein GLOIN_2v1766371 [Rhizophagus clarus]|uniref:Uncharacterized protein n=1 Tax=Rhizophagus clarus TaxID=94130 RepID=A0A8H3QID8_9GLOM|nr:hypothetical protein GLOIN_2v1766371 [Rhizophagus clarus]